MRSLAGCGTETEHDTSGLSGGSFSSAVQYAMNNNNVVTHKYKTSSTEVKQCTTYYKYYCNLCQPLKMVERFRINLLKRYNESENILCKMCVNLAKNNNFVPV